jgi:hypothetical protein
MTSILASGAVGAMTSPPGSGAVSARTAFLALQVGVS